MVIACVLLALSLSADKVNYNADGSVEIIDESGKVKHLKMDGLTPYGQKIENVSKKVQRENFLLELEYSSELSDDILDGVVKQFYDNILASVHARVVKYPDGAVPAHKIKLIMSNCRFCKSGYCRRKNIRDIKIAIYKNDKKIEEKTILHDSLRPTSAPLASEIASELLK